MEVPGGRCPGRWNLHDVTILNLNAKFRAFVGITRYLGCTLHVDQAASTPLRPSARTSAVCADLALASAAVHDQEWSIPA